jgi:hypothetical protein
MKRAPVIALLIFFGIGFLSTHAQLSGTEALTLTVSSTYPRPYQSVTVIPQSTVIDLAASTVTATVNGTQVASGSGAEPIYVTVGGPGTVTNVTVRASYGGQTYIKTVVLRPADVALVVEPQSTTHPFYEGGSLIAAQGRVRIVAIPDLRTSGGGVIPANNLVYTWRNGEQILESASGIGKSVLTANSPVQYRDARITVTVTSQDRSVVAEATAVIAPSESLIRIYRNDPLLGPLFDTALPRSITLGGNEDTFRAVPYYFAEKPPLTWQVNGSASDYDQDITVRMTGSGTGTALLTASAKAPNSSQSTNAALSVKFGENKGFLFFGI